jgi:hypothetical protein
MAIANPAKKKRSIHDRKCIFQEKWELQFFCNIRGKIHCLICDKCIATPNESNLERHYVTNHQSYGKHEGPMRVSKLKELKANLMQEHVSEQCNKPMLLLLLQVMNTAK